jgi:signal transduction histidine kinase
LFVRSSLKNINQLVEYVKHLNIHTLHEPVPLSGPADDEIRIIGETLQQTLTTIKEQTDSLKDFVTHASHELKTPLMSLSAVMDAGEKTGNYAKSFTTAKQTLRTINNLFETLLSITKWEYHNIEKRKIDIIPLIKAIREGLEKTYREKGIVCSLDVPTAYIVHSNEDIFRIIFLNLLQNAYKYTPENGSITIQLKKNTLSVSNS